MRHLLLVAASAALLGCPAKPTPANNSVSLQQVPPPTITQFAADKTSLPPTGGVVTFTWQATGATLVLLDNGGGDVTSLVTTQLSVTQTTTFQLAALNGAGSDVKSVTITVAQAAPVIIGFAATETSLPFGGGTTALSWSVDNASTLSLSPSPGDVTGATFYSASVTANTTYTLTAQSAAGMATASVTINVSPTTTSSGRVITQLGAIGVSGAKVMLLGGAGGSTTADANGAFALPGVAPPYDVAVAPNDGSRVTIYRGLSRLDPTLMALGVFSPVYTAIITGSVSGGVSNAFVGYQPDGGVQGSDNSVTGPFAISGFAGNSFPPSWFGQPFTNGFLFVLDSSTPSAPLFGSTSLPVANDGVFNVTLTTSVLPTFPLAVDCVAPGPSGAGGYTVSTVGAGEGSPLGLGQASGGGGAHEASYSSLWPVFPVPDASTYAECDCGGPGGEFIVYRVGGLAGTSASIQLTPPPAATLTSPTAGAAAVGYGSTFAWANTQSNLVHVLSLTWNHEAAHDPVTSVVLPQVSVVTQASSETLPDLTALRPLVATTGYTWALSSIGPAAVDGLTGPLFPSDYTLGTLATSTRADAGARSFTTP